MIRRRPGARAGLVALLTLLTVLLTVPASADDPGKSQPGGPVVTDPGQEVRTLHMVRLNCDDEAEVFSDEVALYVNDHLSGLQGNLDGGDWWPLHPEIGWTFQGTIKVRFEETSGIVFGDVTISTTDAGRGEITLPWSGGQRTGWRYRFTYYVD
jgi:hypothetical protein